MSDPKAATDILVRFAGPADRAEQARLSAHCFKKPVTADALAWRYDESPHGASIALLSGPAGADGVCGYACSPRILVPRGDRSAAAPVGETGDVMTHPDWRKHGLFRALDARAMEEAARRGWPFVYGLPNRKSAHIFLGIGWRQAGTIRTHTHWLEGGARSRALRRREGRLRSWGSWFAARKSRSAWAGSSTANLEVREWTTFPAEVEALALVLERAHPLCLRRDRDWLEWRFFCGRSRAFRAFGLYRSGVLAAYCVLQRTAADGAAWLVDAAALDEAAFDAAARAALDAARLSGACAVRANAIDGSPWAAKLARWGFQPPRPHDHLIVIVHLHAADHPVAREALDAARWWFTDADRDDETMG